ncbi:MULTISPECIES: helix-turn-helix transcriptional regulator [Clostridioides]|uniref:helix-turn-helix transcriptional regulator n=1 Tax=Clostridioides TaxID=1870884 RepID=UPI0010351476|nr:helix-turn-helix transcriptional regulator [Clostridioides difficile]MCI9976265.1 helix-turn-helix transcriptional regulator [Clostridioides difficile]MDX5761159.1 helix-turn-helix transcriptional regulator [Clostridioides difficile]NJI80426.1 helix-turn-helix transcriptional regulator [Clostridioides difficile]NMU18217.1 helix-turn-helix transcriptional regulator [Clostridioides difficile]HBF4992459.1 helix-turn-helix transcriptional regulator [Clostridioides difficile]
MHNSLVDFRNYKKMTQKEMAKKLGITLTLYSKIELGIRNPSYNFLRKFKLIFRDVNIDEIFFENI